MLKTKTTTTTKKEATPRMATWNKQDIHGKIPKFRLKTYLEPSTTQFGVFFFLSNVPLFIAVLICLYIIKVKSYSLVAA